MPETRQSGPRRTRAANGRSSIYLGGDGRWHGMVSMGTGPDGRPVRKHVTANTQTAVARKVRDLEKARAEGARPTINSRIALTQYLEQWIAKKVKLGTVRPKTVEGYRTDLRRVNATIGHIRLVKLHSRNIEHLWEVMVSEGVLASVQHCKRTLDAALSEAVAYGLIARNPVSAAVTPRYQSSEIQPYTLDEMATLLAAARGTRNAVRWTLALALGLRRGEALGLKWEDIDLDSGTLAVRRQLQRVPWEHGCQDPAACSSSAACPQRFGGGLRTSEPKSDAGRRTIAMPESLTAELRAHRRTQASQRLAAPLWADQDWVLTNQIGQPVDPRNDVRAFKTLCQKAGVPERRLHDLRQLSRYRAPSSRRRPQDHGSNARPLARRHDGPLLARPRRSKESRRGPHGRHSVRT